QIALKYLEYSRDLFGNIFISCKNRMVAINAGSLTVEISCSYVGISYHFIILTTGDKKDLSVYFYFRIGINYIGTLLLKFFSPNDIVFFIKPGFGFDKNRYLFSIVKGFQKATCPCRFICNPVEGNFYLFNIWIIGRLFQETFYIFKGHIRKMNRLVLF